MIPHNRPQVIADDIEKAVTALSSNRLVSGNFIRSLEDQICAYLSLPEGHAVAVSSGTAALYIALKVLNAKDKIVSLPSYACSSLRHAADLAGAKNNIIDITNQFPSPLASEILNSKTDICIYPYLFGLSSALPSEKKTLIIEDCAQAIGASYEGNKLGTLGDIGVFSFYATKIITAGGQGGMIVSKNKNLIDLARDYIDFDMRHDNLSRFNFSLTEVQAAVGCSQLSRLDTILQRRAEIWDSYKSAGINLLDNADNDAVSIRYRAILQTNHPKYLLNHLLENKIQAIIPVEDWELLDNTKINSLAFSRNTISLPIYPALTESQVKYIISKTKEFMEYENIN